MNFSRIFLKRFSPFVILLTIVGALFHFYNLNWGAPFYFHPDERNIAFAVTQLQFPDQMNPHFFAYGSLPIYAIYFTGIIINFVLSFVSPNPSLPSNPSFEQAIVISRFYSALFATLLIPLLYIIALKLTANSQAPRAKTGLIAAFLATTSVGFIQFAHFGTFEMWLTFFTVLLFWICLQKLTKKNLLLMGLIFGILVSTKISSLVLLPLPILAIIFQNTRKNQNIRYFRLSGLLSSLSFLKKTFFILIVAFLVYYLTNPFVFLDTQSFKNSMDYETGLALGKFPVFYTGEFFNTIPIIFQFTNIYPFLLNPLITIIFLPAFVYLMYKTVKTKNQSYFLLSTFYLILFLSQAFLFAKWTRYMVPTLPFIFLIVSFSLTGLLNKFKKPFNHLTILTIFISLNILFAFSYFITSFVRPDTRVAAYQFAQKTIPFDAPILSEVYDLGIVPFNDSFHNISLFNFYDLDNYSPESNLDTLQQQIAQSEYIILPSQRIIKPRLLDDDKFPKGNFFYTQLISGKLRYQKIYETPCDLFCSITYLGDPVYRFEQTANVFDRPTVLIFKKIP